jgi:hypothetical protein
LPPQPWLHAVRKKKLLQWRPHLLLPPLPPLPRLLLLRPLLHLLLQNLPSPDSWEKKPLQGHSLRWLFSVRLRLKR